jgi:hypothetical protein
MAFTPSNLQIANLGSMKLTIATCNIDTVSGTDIWTSGITDVQGVIPVLSQTLPDIASESGSTIAISWTQSTGTIHIMRSTPVSQSALVLYVLSGFAPDMTW